MIASTSRWTSGAFAVSPRARTDCAVPGAGQAPGPDRVTYSQLGPREIGTICRTVAQEILHARFEPSQASQVPIPKPSGGKRTLKIRSIVYRVVSAALVVALGACWPSWKRP